MKTTRWIRFSERLPSEKFKRLLVKGWDGRISEIGFSISKSGNPVFNRIAYYSKSNRKPLKNMAYWFEEYY